MSSKYKLFYAAQYGCLECVERLVREEGVAADAVTNSQTYSAMDFAEWGEKKGIKGRHADVKSFLQKQLPSADGSSATEPQEEPQGSRKAMEKERRCKGLQQPVQAPTAARIMASMGWSAGEGLGATGQGMAEPLTIPEPDTTRRGLGCPQ